MRKSYLQRRQTRGRVSSDLLELWKKDGGGSLMEGGTKTREAEGKMWWALAPLFCADFSCVNFKLDKSTRSQKYIYSYSWRCRAAPHTGKAQLKATATGNGLKRRRLRCCRWRGSSPMIFFGKLGTAKHGREHEKEIIKILWRVPICPRITLGIMGSINASLTRS